MAMLENALAGVLSGEDLTTAVVCLQENDVLTIEDARELSFDDLKELGFSIGMRNKMIKAFEKASDEANLKIGAVCKVIGVATRGELNGKKALVVGHDVAKGLWHITIDGENTKIALRAKNLKMVAAAPAAAPK
jgi:predicted methyltransferase